ncbi:MAG: hypothetical protein NVS4B9_31150 [Ktedonobacteraceae bacterium]
MVWFKSIHDAIHSLALFPPILFWLCQDIVLWLIQTDQIKTFRHRRN